MKSISKIATLLMISLATSAFMLTAYAGTEGKKNEDSEWVQKVNEELKNVDNEIKTMKAKLTGKEMKAAKLEALDEISELRADVANKVSELKGAAKDKMDSLKAEITTALANLKKKKDEVLE